MYGSLKNHYDNLQYSQRFYCNAYQYYNDYEKPEDYEDDLTKLFFKCKRKTIATLVCFGNSFNQSFLQDRSIRFNQFRFQSSQMKDQNQNSITMQKLFQPFIQVFHQNNFSDFKNDLEQNKNKHKILYYPQQRFLKQKTLSQKGKSIRDSVQLDFIQNLIDSFQKNIEYIMAYHESDKIQIDQMPFYSSWLNFQIFHQYQIQTLLKNKEQGGKIITSYNLFKNLIEQLLDQLTDSQSWSHLVLYIPKIPILNYYFNPLTCGIFTFLRKEESLSKSDYHKSEEAEREIPKIVFINLDGRQNPLNIRSIKQCSTVGLMYVTIFFQNVLTEQVEDNQVQQISQMYSKLLINQIYQANKKASDDKKAKGKNSSQIPKIFAFPIDSKYVNKSLKQKHQNLQQINCSLSGSSQDVMFLFDNILFQQIRNYSPNVIIINYNGVIELNEEHFSKIIRTLTVISDHRIILFPNLSNLFQIESSLTTPCSQFAQSKEMNEQDLVKMKVFIQKSQHIEISKVNFNLFYNNLAMFLKISSGTYSFEDRSYSNSSIYQKYETGLKYQYLERLSQLKQFKYYAKFTSKHLKGASLMKLMSRQRKDCIQKNKQNVSEYFSILEQAKKQIIQESDNLPIELKYRYKKIRNIYQQNQKKIYDYLSLKADRLMIQTIKTQKIKKAYYVKASTKQNETDSLYVFNFRQNSPQKQDILLESYSQVIFEQVSDKILNVFVINYRDDSNRLLMMFGRAKLTNSEVLLTQIKQDIDEYNIVDNIQQMNLSSQTNFIQHVNYSYTTFKNYLYLFWPYEWNIKMEAQNQILGIQYKPKIVNKMIKIQIIQKSQTQIQIFYSNIDFKGETNFIPRLNVGAWCQNQTRIYLFGGICSNQKDFQTIQTGVHIINIHQNKFQVISLPKKNNGCKIRPKLNYVISKIDQERLLISGGNGLQFTNFFNIFSYQAYEFNVKTLQIKPKKCVRKVINLPKPMFTRKQGIFQMVKQRLQSSNCLKIEQKVSTQPKYKFILCRKGFYSQKQQNKGCSTVTFLDDDYTTTIYNKQSSFNNICGANNGLDNIYSQRNCSPQIYIWNKAKDLVRIQILLQVSKQVNQYAMKQYIFPNQDSLIAFCTHPTHQKIYILAISTIYTRNSYIIYEGVFKNTQMMAQEKQLKMKIFYQFKSVAQKLEDKVMYSQEYRIMICGGHLNQHNFRQDYLVERIRGKLKLKTIKLKFNPKPFILQMNNPYLLQTENEMFLMYTIALTPNQKWSIKMEEFSLNNKLKRLIKQSQINLNAIWQGKIYKINPTFMKLHFISISKYSKFSFEYLKGKSHALLIQLNKLQDQIQLNQLQRYIKQNILKGIIRGYKDEIQKNIGKIYSQLKKFTNYISKEKFNDSFYIEKSILAWQLLLILVNYQIEKIFYSTFTQKQLIQLQKQQLYRFLIEDRSRSLTKYVAISQLGTTKLKFFQIKTRKPIVSNMMLKKNNDQQYGVNLSERNCNQIYFDQFINYKADVDYERGQIWEDTNQETFQIQTQIFKSNQK